MSRRTEADMELVAANLNPFKIAFVLSDSNVAAKMRKLSNEAPLCTRDAKAQAVFSHSTSFSVFIVVRGCGVECPPL
jgi:hypothetical protein